MLGLTNLGVVHTAVSLVAVQLRWLKRVGAT